MDRANEQPLKVLVADDGVATLRLDRPDKRNALSIALRDAISDTLHDWQDDESVRVVVLTGAPPVFSAGFDLGEFQDPALARTIRHSSARYHRVVWSFPKPTVAAVNGHALGGGFDLATLCDLRVAATGATFGHPEIKFGAPPLFTPIEEARTVALQIAEAPQRTLQATKRYLTGNQGLGFEDSFRIEHDDVFDNFLTMGVEGAS